MEWDFFLSFIFKPKSKGASKIANEVEKYWLVCQKISNNPSFKQAIG